MCNRRSSQICISIYWTMYINQYWYFQVSLYIHSCVCGLGGGCPCCCCCSHVLIAHGQWTWREFEGLLTSTEWVKFHALQKSMYLYVDPHTLWNLLNYYHTLGIEYWEVCTLCHSTLWPLTTTVIQYHRSACWKLGCMILFANFNQGWHLPLAWVWTQAAVA